jgi:hypothetical protein
MIRSKGELPDYQHLPAFLPGPEVDRWLARLAALSGEFLETHGRAGLGPLYRVLDGDQLRHHLPEIAALGSERVRPAAEAFAGGPLAPFGSARRAMRVQIYSRRQHGFRWHRDGHDYVGLLTLRNTNRGQTQFLAAAVSRVARFALYPLYPVPQAFSLLPRRSVEPAAGDLLLMRGARAIHRGVTLAEQGERVTVVYAFDAPGKRPSALRDRLAKLLNY